MAPVTGVHKEALKISKVAHLPVDGLFLVACEADGARHPFSYVVLFAGSLASLMPPRVSFLITSLSSPLSPEPRTWPKVKNPTRFSWSPGFPSLRGRPWIRAHFVQASECRSVDVPLRVDQQEVLL